MGTLKLHGDNLASFCVRRTVGKGRTCSCRLHGMQCGQGSPTDRGVDTLWPLLRVPVCAGCSRQGSWYAQEGQYQSPGPALIPRLHLKKDILLPSGSESRHMLGIPEVAGNAPNPHTPPARAMLGDSGCPATLKENIPLKTVTLSHSILRRPAAPCQVHSPSLQEASLTLSALRAQGLLHGWPALASS